MKIDILTSNENGMYVARCPLLPGCTSRAATLDEALEKHEKAIWGYLAAATNFVPERIVLRIGGEHRTSHAPDKAFTAA